MTNYYTVFEKCKNKECKFKSDNQKDYDDEGYCMACSEIKSDIKRETSN